jgi:hypothetical protein
LRNQQNALAALIGRTSVRWWRRLDSNQRPRDYETLALAT